MHESDGKSGAGGLRLGEVAIHVHAWPRQRFLRFSCDERMDELAEYSFLSQAHLHPVKRKFTKK